MKTEISVYCMLVGHSALADVMYSLNQDLKIRVDGITNALTNAIQQPATITWSVEPQGAVYIEAITEHANAVVFPALMAQIGAILDSSSYAANDALVSAMPKQYKDVSNRSSTNYHVKTLSDLCIPCGVMMHKCEGVVYMLRDHTLSIKTIPMEIAGPSKLLLNYQVNVVILFEQKL